MKTTPGFAAANGDVQNTLEGRVDKATAVAHNSIDSFSQAARPALDHVVTSAHTAVDRAGVSAAHAAKTLGEKGDQLNDSGKRMAERAEGYVREHPLASLGMAVAASYLLSRLFSNR